MIGPLFRLDSTENQRITVEAQRTVPSRTHHPASVLVLATGLFACSSTTAADSGAASEEQDQKIAEFFEARGVDPKDVVTVEGDVSFDGQDVLATIAMTESSVSRRKHVACVPDLYFAPVCFVGGGSMLRACFDLDLALR